MVRGPRVGAGLDQRAHAVDATALGGANQRRVESLAPPQHTQTRTHKTSEHIAPETNRQTAERIMSANRHANNDSSQICKIVNARIYTNSKYFCMDSSTHIHENP
jgi:hypothetical protein